MSAATHRWADELKSSVDVLKTMRDEVKVQVHLGNMEAKQRLETLEKRFEHEQANARRAFEELASGFKMLKDSLPHR